MKNEITLIKNNAKKEQDDVEWIQGFYNFLKGEVPETMTLRRGHQPKMSEKKAFSIIYYLQEHLPVFPDRIERCDTCGFLFDSYSEGLYWESKGKHYCGSCEYLVPENYDNCKR